MEKNETTSTTAKDEFPLAVPLLNTITEHDHVLFRYGPNDVTDSILVSKLKLMAFSYVLKAMILMDPSKSKVDLAVKYPATFRKYFVPLLSHNNEDTSSTEEAEANTNELEHKKRHQFRDLFTLYQQLREKEAEVPHLCYLFQMAEYLGLGDETKNDLREILAENVATESPKPEFSPDNITPSQMLDFCEWSKYESHESLTVILYWLQGSSRKFCGQMKIWFERKLKCSFNDCLGFKLDKVHQPVVDTFFTVSDILSIYTTIYK